MVMGKMAMSTGASAGQTAWSARTNIMYGLFDLGRLMIDDKRKLNVFHDEIARLCNEAYDRVRDVVESDKDLEDHAFQENFGYTERARSASYHTEPHSVLTEHLHGLIKFMYSDREEVQDGFMARVYRIIDKQYLLHYHHETIELN
jgi:hypothetical protein